MWPFDKLFSSLQKRTLSWVISLLENSWRMIYYYFALVLLNSTFSGVDHLSFRLQLRMCRNRRNRLLQQQKQQQSLAAGRYDLLPRDLIMHILDFVYMPYSSTIEQPKRFLGEFAGLEKQQLCGLQSVCGRFKNDTDRTVRLIFRSIVITPFYTRDVSLAISEISGPFVASQLRYLALEVPVNQRMARLLRNHFDSAKFTRLQSIKLYVCEPGPLDHPLQTEALAPLLRSDLMARKLTHLAFNCDAQLDEDETLELLLAIKGRCKALRSLCGLALPSDASSPRNLLATELKEIAFKVRLSSTSQPLKTQLSALCSVAEHASDVEIHFPQVHVHLTPSVSLDDEVLDVFRSKPLQRISFRIDRCAEYFSLRVFRQYPQIRKIECTSMPVTSLVGLRLLPNLMSLSLLVQMDVLLALDQRHQSTSKHTGFDMMKQLTQCPKLEKFEIIVDTNELSQQVMEASQQFVDDLLRSVLPKCGRLNSLKLQYNSLMHITTSDLAIERLGRMELRVLHLTNIFGHAVYIEKLMRAMIKHRRTPLEHLLLQFDRATERSIHNNRILTSVLCNPLVRNLTFRYQHSNYNQECEEILASGLLESMTAPSTIASQRLYNIF